jgi:hypothetical protein
MYFLPRGFEEVKTVALNDVNDESFWMLFRTQKAGEQSAAMDALRSKGYFECPSTPIKYGSTNIFKLQMVKEEARCVK